jgi:hypothetical protein
MVIWNCPIRNAYGIHEEHRNYPESTKVIFRVQTVQRMQVQV